MIPDPVPPPEFPLSTLHYHATVRLTDIVKIPVEDKHEELRLTEEDLKKIQG